MFFVALATDYDGTLAHHGVVDAATIESLKKLRASGRKLIMVTGRELPDLRGVCPHIDLFDLVVAENGALLYDPATKEETVLTDPPPPALVARLQACGVAPMSVGRSILATWEPHETVVLKAIRELGLELHIIFNKGAVMVLPSDVNKATGLKSALKKLGLSAHNVVGIGDAENDQAFLSACGCGVAVANALQSVKDKCDFVVADHGAGVVELVGMLTQDDLAPAKRWVPRAQTVLGERADKSPLQLSPFETVLITGASGSGKSTLVTAMLEHMRKCAFQFCVVDPEGDYADLSDAVVVGDAAQEPRISEVMDLLAKPEVNVVVCLLALDPEERPRFLAEFLPELAKLRAETGRPHWIVLDEVQHCLPVKWDPAPVPLPRELPAAIAVTVHPEELAPPLRELISTVVGVGSGALAAIQRFRQASGWPTDDKAPPELQPGEVYVLKRGSAVEVIRAAKPKERQKRHVRKYAEGDLGEDASFYFRGPDGKLNLRAQNLKTFLQLAAGVDDTTWLHHLRAEEYSTWFREAIKDEDLAAETRAVERGQGVSARDSRARIKDLVDRRYTAPARTGE
ncbi:MAG: HAD-IIB family hydrolase [Hyphomicrobiaceae bacterium]